MARQIFLPHGILETRGNNKSPYDTLTTLYTWEGGGSSLKFLFQSEHNIPLFPYFILIRERGVVQ